MHELLERWISPAGVLIVFGGVVWGVQLNVATMNLTKEVAMIDGKAKKISAELTEISNNTIRTTIILGNLADRVDDAMGHVETHNEESEDWKRRIMLNEQRMKDIERRYGERK